MSEFEEEKLKEIIKDLELLSKHKTCSYLFEEVIELLKQILDYDD